MKLLLAVAVPALVLAGGLAVYRGVPWHRIRPRHGRLLRTACVGALSAAGAASLVWALLPVGGGALPYLGQALGRLLLAVIALVLVLAAALVLGLGLLRLLGWPTSGWREALLYGSGTGLGLLGYLALGLAQLGLYTPTAVSLLVAALVVAGCTIGVMRLRHGGVALVNRIQPGISKWPPRSSDAVWAAISLAAVSVAFVAALAPEREYDALWYHLQLPRVWLEQGHLVALPGEYISFYPGTWQLIFGTGLVLGGGVGAKLLHFVCLPLTGLAVYQVTARFLPSVSPWLAVALFVTVPTVIWEATTAYVDLALTLHVILVVYALLRFVEERSRAWLLLAGLQLGFALATKHLALLVFALAVGGLLLRLWSEHRNLWRALTPPVAFAAMGLAIAAPWYIRSWLATGNPVFPELFALFGAPPDQWDARTQAGLNAFLARFGPRNWPDLLVLPWDMTVNGARYGGTLGPAFLLLLPALLLRAPFRSGVSLWLLAFAAGYIALWASPVSSYQMRFLVVVTPVLAILTAEAAGRAATRIGEIGAWAKRSVYVAIGLVLVLDLPPFTRLHEGNRVGREGWLTHVVRSIPLNVVLGRISEEAYLQRAVSSYAAWQYINDHLPADVRVLTFSGGDHFYSDRARLWSDATLTRAATWGAAAGEEDAVLARLRALGVSHVLFDRQQLEALEPGSVAIAQPTFVNRWLVKEYRDEGFVLYRLRRKAASSQPR